MRDSDDKFRLMADHAPVMLWKAGRDAECDFFNARWLEFTGRPLEQELGVGWAGGLHPQDFSASMDRYMEAFVAEREFRMEYRLRRHDGVYRWILDHGVPHRDAAGVFQGFIGSCIDITDMREAAAQVRSLADALQERLEEREVLLREVHHRVKNNLQLITSMHSLQARQLSGEARAQVEDAQRRVKSIALVHERLCEPATLGEVDFLGYLRDAVQSVLQVADDGARVEVQVTGDALRLPVDQAVPCGLLVSELVTNSLKHAFPGARRGAVRIELLSLDAGRVRLSVDDDGVGLPPDFDIHRPASTGLDLIGALAHQLGGRIEHRAGAGTRIGVEFVLNGGGV